MNRNPSGNDRGALSPLDAARGMKTVFHPLIKGFST